MTISITNHTGCNIAINYPNGTYHLQPGKEMSTAYKGRFTFTRPDLATCGYPLSNGKFKITFIGLEAVKETRVFDHWQGGNPLIWLFK